MHWKISPRRCRLAGVNDRRGAVLSRPVSGGGGEQARQHMEAQAEAQHAALAQVNRQMQTVAALDSQHTRELEHDKNRIVQLERDVADGRRRLQVRTACERVSASGPPARMDDAASARFDDAARRDYFTLRARIERANRQINGLQDYVRQVCLNPHSGE